jgi:hypothetical protein
MKKSIIIISLLISFFIACSKEDDETGMYDVSINVTGQGIPNEFTFIREMAEGDTFAFWISDKDYFYYAKLGDKSVSGTQSKRINNVLFIKDGKINVKWYNF